MGMKQRKCPVCGKPRRYEAGFRTGPRADDHRAVSLERRDGEPVTVLICGHCADRIADHPSARPALYKPFTE